MSELITWVNDGTGEEPMSQKETDEMFGDLMEITSIGQQAIMDWFRSNPGKWLSHIDCAETMRATVCFWYPMNNGDVHEALSRLVHDGWLETKEIEGHYCYGITVKGYVDRLHKSYYIGRK